MCNTRNICFVMPHFFFENKGGAELQVYYLARELALRGWQVNYIREKSKVDFSEKNFEGIKLHVIYIPKILAHPKLLFAKQILRRIQLYFLQKRLKPTIIYVRADESYLPLFGRNLDKNKIKLVWACSHDDKLKPHHWSDKYGPAIKKSILRALNNSSLILLQTEFQKQLLSENFGFNGKVLYNAHPLPFDLNLTREDVVIWVGRLHKRKFPERFLSIVKKMKSNSNIKFIMVGRRLKSRFDDEIQSTLKENPNFHYYGESEQEFILGMLNKVKVLVNTSDSEGFSNTFIEAWLRGVPVITLKGVNPDDLITKNGVGFVCDDIDEIQKRISEILNNSSLFSQMSLESKRMSKEKFDLEKYVDKFIDEVCKF
jgi:glycosyltransferase involved in cell wall biosynthesis